MSISQVMCLQGRDICVDYEADSSN